MAIIFSHVLGDIALAVVTCLIVAYLYFAPLYQYWKRRGVHYVKPTLFVGNLGELVLQRASLGQCMQTFYQNNVGHPVVGLYLFAKPTLLIRNLELVRSVLVKDAQTFMDRSLTTSANSKSLSSRTLVMLKGKTWRHMRVKLTPTFSSGKMKKMFHLMNECGKGLVQCIDQETSQGKSVRVKDTVARYSTDVIASCAFGVNANALADSNSEFRGVVKNMVEPKGIEKFATLISSFAPPVSKLLRLKGVDEKIGSYIRTTFWDVVDYRKNNGVVRGDFVDILMQLKNEGEIRAEDKKELEEIKADSKYMITEDIRKEKLDIELEDDDFVAQAYIFIAAGFETSSSVISTTLYELALNTHVQGKLRTEIQTVLDKHNSEVTYDAIAEMSYLDMVISEAMRKYPTVPQLERKCLQDYKIPGTDITIEKGTSVMIPVLGIHMDPAIYPEPHKFDPERFSPENKKKRSHFAHLPFGEGPRICIGMRFGLVQVKTALVYILTSYLISTCAETPTPPLKMKPNAGISLPKTDIVLAFTKIT